MEDSEYLQMIRARGGFEGTSVTLVSVPQQQTLSRGGGLGYHVQPSSQEKPGGGPLTPSSSKEQSGGGTSGYPTLGHEDLVKQLQFKISSLEYKLMCSYADTENFRLELDERTKAFEGLNKKCIKLEEDLQFTQKCAKLEGKIARNKAKCANEKILELEEAVRGLEGDKESLEESVQKQETELAIHRSLIARSRGTFQMIVEAAKENCKQIDSFVPGLSEKGCITSEGSVASTTREEICSKNTDSTDLAFYMKSPRSSWRSSMSYNSGNGSGAWRVSNVYDGFDSKGDISPPPPAAFLDAIRSLTLEDIEELERMYMERDKDVNPN